MSFIRVLFYNLKYTIMYSKNDRRFPSQTEILEKAFSELSIKQHRINLSTVMFPVTNALLNKSVVIEKFTPKEQAFIREYKIQTRIDIELLINGVYNRRGFMTSEEFDSAVNSGSAPIIASLSSLGFATKNRDDSSNNIRASAIKDGDIITIFHSSKLISNFKVSIWQISRDDLIAGLKKVVGAKISAEAWAEVFLDGDTAQMISGILTKHNHVYNGLSPRALKSKYNISPMVVMYDVKGLPYNDLMCKELEEIRNIVDSVDTSKKSVIIKTILLDYTGPLYLNNLATSYAKVGIACEIIPMPMHFPDAQIMEYAQSYGFTHICVPKKSLDSAQNDVKPNIISYTQLNYNEKNDGNMVKLTPDLINLWIQEKNKHCIEKTAFEALI